MQAVFLTDNEMGLGYSMSARILVCDARKTGSVRVISRQDETDQMLSLSVDAGFQVTELPVAEANTQPIAVSALDGRPFPEETTG